MEFYTIIACVWGLAALMWVVGGVYQIRSRYGSSGMGGVNLGVAALNFFVAGLYLSL